MRLEAIRLWWRQPNHLVRTAISLWVSVLLIISTKVLVAPASHSCYPIFIGAARHWQQGLGIYPNAQTTISDLDSYRYSPLVAILLLPLTIVPDGLGGVLWRLLNAGVLLGGLAWLCRALASRPFTRSEQALIFLLVLPLAIGNLHNGQANPLVLGLLLASVAAVARQRWNWTGVFLALAILLKLYPAALALLLIALYPRQLAWRVLAALLVGLGLPYLCQHPVFVGGQYQDWLNCIRADDRSGFAVEYGYRDLALLSRLLQFPLSQNGYRLVELFAGLAIAGVVLMQRQRLSEKSLLLLVLGLGSCWMTVFGPATESCTYLLLGPALIWGLIEAVRTNQPLWCRVGWLASYALLLVAYAACWFPGGRNLQALGLQPLAGLLLLFHLLQGTKRDGTSGNQSQHCLSGVSGRGSIASLPS